MPEDRLSQYNGGWFLSHSPNDFITAPSPPIKEQHPRYSPFLRSKFRVEMGFELLSASRVDYVYMVKLSVLFPSC